MMTRFSWLSLPVMKLRSPMVMPSFLAVTRVAAPISNFFQSSSVVKLLSLPLFSLESPVPMTSFMLVMRSVLESRFTLVYMVYSGYWSSVSMEVFLPSTMAL